MRSLRVEGGVPAALVGISCGRRHRCVLRTRRDAGLTFEQTGKKWRNFDQERNVSAVASPVGTVPGIEDQGPCANCARQQQVHPGRATLWNLQYKVSAEQIGYCHGKFSPICCFSYCLCGERAGAAHFHENNSRNGHVKIEELCNPAAIVWRFRRVPRRSPAPMRRWSNPKHVRDEPCAADRRAAMSALSWMSNGTRVLRLSPVLGTAATKVGPTPKGIGLFLLYNRNWKWARCHFLKDFRTNGICFNRSCH